MKTTNQTKGSKTVAKKSSKPAVKAAPAKVEAKPAKKGGVCLCGCGEAVAGSFRQGHDARAKSMMRAAHGDERVFATIAKLGNIAAAVRALGFGKAKAAPAAKVTAPKKTAPQAIPVVA